MRSRGIGRVSIASATAGSGKYLGGGKYKATKKMGGKEVTVIYKKIGGKKVIISTWKKFKK